MKRKTRVAILTSGGDCQGLNAAIRGVGKALTQYVENIEIFGMYDGYRGLAESDYRFMEAKDFSGILSVGGTLLGTSRQKYIPGQAILDAEGNDMMPAMLDTYTRLNLDCVVVMGGNGTQKSAKLLMDAGMNVITLPKTIDNDIYGTEMTFGFQSAVDIATNVMDYIHTTASSHRRIFIVELMGRDAGWLTLHAGIASGADVILIPEIPYDLESVAETIERRKRQGRHYSILAVAEGAVANGGRLAFRGRAPGAEGAKRLSYHFLPYRQGAANPDRPTDPGHHSGALSAGRPALPLRPGAGHPVRHGCGPADHGKTLWQHGGHAKRGHRGRAPGGSGQQDQVFAYGPSPDPGGPGCGHRLWRLRRTP